MFDRLFQGGSMSPHGICLLWNPALIWAHVTADAIIAACYFSIPVALASFVAKRRDIAFSWVYLCFATFILACGATHLLAIWTIWVPDYELEALVKAVTAAASIWTATALWVLLPKALLMPSTSQLQDANRALSERVTERDRALEDLKEKNRVLELAEAMVHAGHWRLEMPTRRRTWSSGMNRIFGLEPGASPPDFESERNGYHQGDGETVKAAFAEAFSSGLPLSIEARIERPDGEIRTVAIQGVCVNNVDGRVDALFGVSLDITDLKRTEETLRLRKHQLRALLDNSPALIGCWNRDLRNVLANRTYQEWYGRDPNLLPGMHIRDVIGETAFAREQQFIKGALQGKPQRFERRIAKPDGGGDRHTLVSFVPDVRDGHVEGFFSLVTDISERKQAEDSLRSSEEFLDRIGKVAGTGGWEIDLRSNTVRWSEHTRKIHEVDETYVPTLESGLAFYEPESGSVIREAYSRALKAGTPWDHEVRLVTAKGRQIWVRAAGEVEFLDGTPIRVFGVLQDITERKSAQFEIEEARRIAEEARADAEAANRTKSEFLATMSHEIRTPLNSIIGYSDLLLESGDLEARDRDKVEIVQASGEALLTIVNDILDFAKIEAGRMTLRQEVFQVRGLVGEAIAMVSAAAGRKELSIKTSIAPRVPLWVRGDANRLRQVLLNLLNNAVKFTTQGGIRVLVTSASDAALRFTVDDDGIGIPIEKQALLFTRFSQVDGPIVRRFGGTGLGLAISKALVDLMGGSIQVESAEDRGSSFSFTSILPETDAPSQIQEEPGEVGLATGRRARILVVDDVRINRELARRVVIAAGHVADMAETGEEAIAKAMGEGYDLILMDVQMPGIDGLTATRAIRDADHPARSTPIYGMTANVLPQQVAALEAAGMNGHIGKPFKKKDLLAIINRVMENAAIVRLTAEAS